MKNLIVFLLFIYSCQTKDDENISLLIQQNNQLIERATQDINYAYDDFKEDNAYQNILVINRWQNKGHKIDSILKLHYRSAEKNKFKDIFKLHKNLEPKILSVILDQEDYPLRIESYKNEIPHFFEKDSHSLYQLLNSKCTDSTKALLIQNFYNLKTLKLLTYCQENTPRKMRCLYYEKFASVAVIDKNIAIAGQKLTLLAGVGQFTDKTRPSFILNDKINIPITDGIAQYSFYADKRVGKHKMKLKIIETKQDGSITTNIKEVEYETVDTICK